MNDPKYYHIDTGFFPQIIKLAFSNDALQQIFADSQIAVSIRAFEHGEAETHTIHTHLGDMIIIVVDPDNYTDDETETRIVGVIAHECSHALEKLGEFLGEDNIAGETRAYLLQSLVEQVYNASLIEREERARKRSRKLPVKASKAKRGTKPKVDKHNNGRSRSNRVSKSKDLLSGTENGKGDTISETEDSIRATKATRVSGRSTSK